MQALLCAQVCMSMLLFASEYEVRGQFLVFSLISCFILFFNTGSLTEPEAHKFDQTSWPTNMPDSPVFASPVIRG